MRKEKILIKIWSILIIMIMTLNITTPIISYAITEGTTETYNGFILEKTDTEINIIGYEGAENTVTIPEEYDGYTIKNVKIDGSDVLKSITVPNTIENLELRNLSKLETVEIETSEELSSLKRLILFNNTLIEKINIPDGVKEVSFAYCESLKSAIIPDSVTNLGIDGNVNWGIDNGFAGCNALEYVKLGTGITKIVNYCFFCCDNLKSIEIPHSVVEIGQNAFNGCTSLSDIILPENLETIGSNCFDTCTSLEKINLPSNLKTIWNQAFIKSGLKEISIPEGTTIKSGTFIDCKNLTKVELPLNMTYIPDNCFLRCTSLKEIEIPELVTEIRGAAFSKCTSLKSITILPSVISIADSAFSDGADGFVLEAIYGYEDTTAEKYADENDIKFIAIDGIWVAKNIPENHYTLTILGKNRERLYNISAIIDEITYESADGTISFEKDKYEVGKEITVKVIVDEEEYTLNHTINESGKGFIKLPSSTYELINATVNGHEVLTSTKILNLCGIDTATFELSIPNTAEEVLFQICQGDDILGTKLGKSKATLNISTANLKKGKFVYAKICDKDLNIISETRLNLSLVEIFMFQNAPEIEMGENIKITLPDNMGPLAGAEFELPIGNDNGLGALQYELTDEKMKIGLTTKKEELELSDKAFEEAVKKILDGSKEKFSDKYSFEYDLALYYEAVFDNGIFVENKTYGAISLEFKQSMSYDTIVYIVPVTLKVSASIDGTVTLGFAYDYDKAELKTIGDIEIGGKLKLNAGLGCSLASAGVYGKIGTKLKLDLMPKFAFNKFEVSGEAGVYAEIFGFEQTFPIIRPEVKLILDKNLEWNVEDKLKPVSLYNINAYDATARNSSVMLLAWNEEQEATSDEKYLLADDIYTYTNQDIISNSADTMMLFIDNDILRNDYNFKTLKYSLYDKETKTWGTPIQLDSNETQDNNFIAYTDGTDIYVIYTEEKIELTENNEIGDYAKNQEIVVAKWNSEAKTFDAITALTNNQTYDMLPQISIIDDIPTAVWVNNASNSAFGTTTDNSILYSKFENGVWSEPETLISGQNAITEIEVGEIGTESYIVAIIDDDNDLSTETDRNLKTIDFNGNEKTISTSSNSNIDIITYNNTNTLTWYNNENISTLSDVNGEISTLFTENIEGLTSNNLITKKQNSLVVLYLSETENGQGIYQIIQDDNGSFGSPICVLETEDSITCYDAIFDQQELLVCYTETQVNTENDEIQKTSNLYSFYSNDGFDIEISNVEYDAKTFVPGEETTISVYVKNNAEIKTRKINIKILDLDSNEIYNQTFDKEILSGNTEKIDLTNISISKSDTYTIIVNEMEQTESYLDNNQKIVDIVHSDLNVSADQIVTNDGNYALVRIDNQGEFDAENVILNVLNGEDVVDTANIDNIAAYSTNIVWVYLKDEYFAEGRNEGIITFEVVTDTEELHLSDNKFALSALDYDKYLLGDINFDGEVTSYDSHIVLKKLSEESEFSAKELNIADMNNDAIITSDDAYLILEYVANN